ncbi:superinfection immunity protein [Streptomyces catenulae]|uniref:Superinfection immunity protein n=1 Tax=Streptomyces catenulae TaxID=66875 RepID=A0ABV2Z0I1_9ACTN|nr:superinfection immunity protein [Streptomyces catenulae]
MNDQEVWCKVLGDIGIGLTIVLAVLALVVFFIPTYVAFHREVENRWLVLAINVFFGGTLVGWVIALILATRKPAVQQGAAA